MGLWSGLDHALYPDGYCGFFGMEEGVKTEECTDRPVDLFGSTRLEYPLVDPLFWVAESDVGVCGDPLSLGGDRCNDRGVLPPFEGCGVAVGAISVVGEFCRVSELRYLDVEPNRLRALDPEKRRPHTE